MLTAGLAVSGNGMMVVASEQEAAPPLGKSTEVASVKGISENHITKEEKPETKASGPETYVSRIVTFTDYTGMRVTYDANASQQYIYEVQDGVLTSVKMKKAGKEGRETLEKVNFEGNVELKQPGEGEKYTSIAADIFADNSYITYVRLPAGVTAIEAGSFKGCTALKSVYLPSTVSVIGDSAFEGCTAMTQICVPKALKTIGDSAFKGNKELRTVYRKDAEESERMTVGDDAFSGCVNLEP